MSKPVRVLIADDQGLVREGLMTLLAAQQGIEPVATAADGEEAVAATRQIRAAHPQIEIVALTTYADDASILGALQAGARGYLTKDAGAAEIARAVHAAAAGQTLLDPAVQQRLIAAGLSNLEIADRLVISEATVKTHVNHLFAKTGARDRAQAVHYAYDHGLAG